MPFREGCLQGGDQLSAGLSPRPDCLNQAFYINRDCGDPARGLRRRRGRGLCGDRERRLRGQRWVEAPSVAGEPHPPPHPAIARHPPRSPAK
jgi:hypothetical protein